MTKKTYSEAVKEIETIVEKIEQENLDVDELNELVKKASKLVNYCKDKLRKTEQDLNDTLEGMDK